MSSPSSFPVNQGSFVAPTPQNTPLNPAPIASRLSRPTVADIPESDDNEDEDGSPGGPSAEEQAISSLMQRKLSSLIGKSSGYIESLPIPVKRRVEGLKGVQTEFYKIEREHKREIYELEQKYLELYKPTFSRRLEIISGKAEPTTEEVVAGEAQSLKDDPDATPLPADASDPNAEAASAGIPEFWLTVLKNHIAISELVTSNDEAALRHLTDITLEYSSSDQPGFKLLFHFSPNEFFDNEVLTKEYKYQEELGYGGDYVYDHAIGCTIAWKEDKNLTQEVEVKRQRNKATNRTRVIRRAKPTASFFNFFAPPKPLDPEALENGDVDEEEAEELEESLELDYQIGEDIKERVIPRAIDYFTGKALEYEGLDDDDDDDEDFDDDDDEFDDEDEDDDDDVPAARRRAPKAASNNVDPQECKQQ